MNSLNWAEIEELALELEHSDGTIEERLRNQLVQYLSTVVQTGDDEAIIRFAETFRFLSSGLGEQWLLTAFVVAYSDAAIEAAIRLGRPKLAGQYHYDLGHLRHRQGKHRLAIQRFDTAFNYFSQAGETFRAREAYFMTSLCYRALGSTNKALEIIEQVLRETGDDPWRANPLEVRAWIEQARGDLTRAEATLRQVLDGYRELGSSYFPQLAQALADMGEILSLKGDIDGAMDCFRESRSRLESLSPTDYRLLIRTLIKQAEALLYAGRIADAEKTLHDADRQLPGAGHYDLRWRVFFALSLVNFRQLRLQDAWYHFSLTRRYRQELGLSTMRLLIDTVLRLIRRAGLPR